jgi:hypothetical protein
VSLPEAIARSFRAWLLEAPDGPAAPAPVSRAFVSGQASVPGWLQRLLIAGLFVALTVVMTWPQITQIATHARDHHDVYFNMWRLAWVAHALTTSPQHLFDGNIFYPEPRAMTYSDAIFVEGLFATPLLIAGVPPVLVHNLLLLGAIVGSAIGIYVLTRHLTGSPAAGVVAGVIFGFAPYRFEHYMHMEMQWTVWMPWAFWALHRTIETRVWRYGLLTGLFVSLQMMSSIYYGVFLIVLLGVVTLVLLISFPLKAMLATLPRFVPAAVVVALLCGAYALPYLETKKDVGGRNETEIIMYSARPSSYLVATPDNIIYGRTFASRGRPERRLFPGTLAVVLAGVGVFMRPAASGVIAIAYFLAMVLAFEMSLGLSGYSYRYLYDHVTIFQGFRAIARLGIFVVFFLAILAAYGYAAIVDGRRGVARGVIAVIVTSLLLMEYRVQPLHLVPYPNEAPPLHAWLAGQPRGVVAELPMPDVVPGSDPRSSYLSTFHWQPLVNGYSGFVPLSYLDRIDQMRSFPDEQSLARLRKDGVRYLVLHLAEYPKDEGIHTVHALTVLYGLRELGRFSDGLGECVVFLLR